ncbi:MAG: electron transport complex subunit RsxC, partial [Oscillospiraceae bacterium]
KTFRGGVHPNDMKAPTQDKKIINLPAPPELVFPLGQHIGAPCTPCVSVGDAVCMGQKIGESAGFVSACIHSSVSGSVKAIEKRMHPNGYFVQSVVIENDGLDTMDASVKKPDKSYKNMTKNEITEIIKNAGIVGMGGATFPTHVKLSPPAEAKIDYIIVNGAECEPYLTSDYRAMLETTDNVIGGLQILLHMFGLKIGYIGIEDNKPEAISVMKQAASLVKDVEIVIVPLKTKYPQGGEKQLINVVTGRKLAPGQLPYQVGTIVHNIDTCASIYRAVTLGRPLMHRIVTIGGDCISTPSNLRIRIGTPFRALFDGVGGFIESPEKVIMGGPMMGMALPNIDVPTIKGTSGALAFSANLSKQLEETACLRCGKCVYVCPMGLLPNVLDSAARERDFEKLEKFNISDCMECGSCAFVCPSKRRQVQQIKVAKDMLKNRQIKAK